MNNPLSISKKLYLSTNDLMRVTEVKGNNLIHILDECYYLYYREKKSVSMQNNNQNQSNELMIGCSIREEIEEFVPKKNSFYLIMKQIAMTESPLNRIINYNYFDFYTFSSLLINQNTKHLYSSKKNNFLEHKGFNFHNKSLTFQFNIETINSSNGILCLLFKDSNNNAVAQVILDNRYGIIIRELTSDGFSFYDPKVRDLFTFSTSMIIFYNRQSREIAISIKDYDKLQRIKVVHKLSKDVKVHLESFSVDLKNSGNMKLTNIEKYNSLLYEYYYYMDLWNARTELNFDVKYVDKFTNGDLCDKETNQHYETIIEYFCDEDNIHEASIESVKQESKCTYNYKVKSYLLCNPLRNKDLRMKHKPVPLDCFVKTNN